MSTKPAIAIFSMVLALAAGVTLGVLSAQPAHAEGKSATCRWDLFTGSAVKTTPALEAWMTEQLSAGKTEFVAIPTASVQYFCAY